MATSPGVLSRTSTDSASFADAVAAPSRRPDDATLRGDEEGRTRLPLPAQTDPEEVGRLTGRLDAGGGRNGPRELGAFSTVRRPLLEAGVRYNPRAWVGRERARSPRGSGR